MKKHQFVFIIVLMLIVASSTVALANESVTWPNSDHVNELDPEYQLLAEAVSTPWLDSIESEDLIYFIFQSPAKIERYDLNSEMWLPEISLSDVPTAFTVDGQGLYISFGTRTSRFNLDGTSEVHLLNTSNDATGLHTIGQFIYIVYADYPYGKITSADKASGMLIDSRSYIYDLFVGSSIAPTIGKLFARSSGISPSDIMQVILYPDGTLGAANDSPYHGDYPSASKTFVFSDEALVVDNAGIIYNTADLTYANSLAGSFDDIAFYGELPIVLRDGTLFAYSKDFLETGRYTPNTQPLKIYVQGKYIYAFSDGGGQIDVSKINIKRLQPEKPGKPVDPNSLAYLPDSVLVGDDGIVYLLSKSNLSIFRWSIAEQRYLETIPLNETPYLMAYSAEPERLFLAYTSGRITSISLNRGRLVEKSFVNSPQQPRGLVAAGEYLFVCDPTGPWYSHFTYSPSGELLSQVDWNYYSTEFVWNETNRKMYFLRDNVIPNDLLWEDIDEYGTIGVKQDSPYHDSAGMTHPIRVAPDGSVVILGSGRIYDAISLEQINLLPNVIKDALWINYTLFTMRELDGTTQLQEWDTNYDIQATLSLEGTPLRIFPSNDGFLAITYLDARPWMSILDQDFNIIYQSPAD